MKEDLIRIWLSNAELLNGKLSDGVSLNTLFNKFADHTFVWSKEEFNKGFPNRHKRAMSSFYSHIELTIEAADHLNQLLDECFKKHGRIQI